MSCDFTVAQAFNPFSLYSMLKLLKKQFNIPTDLIVSCYTHISTAMITTTNGRGRTVADGRGRTAADGRGRVENLFICISCNIHSLPKYYEDLII